MGGLHAGHEALFKQSIAAHDKTVVSIYVNPLQFGPQEDFKTYPRPILGDTIRLQPYERHIHVWRPTDRMIYPNGLDQAIKLDTGALGQRWCGQMRPQFFNGVATVVLKLCLQVRPSHLYLGEKDYQQYRVIQQLFTDFAIPVKLVLCPTVREADGLAFSTRNQYLSPDDRALAPVGYAAIQAMQRAFCAGEVDADTLVQLGRDQLHQVKIAYLGIADAQTLVPISGPVSDTDRIMLAFTINQTRLIDNAPLLDPDRSLSLYYKSGGD